MWMWPEIPVSRVLQRRVQFPIIFPCEIQCFQCHHCVCSFTSLFPACSRNILFDLDVSTWKWLLTRFPEPQDTWSNKEFCSYDGHYCQSRNVPDFSRFFKLRSREGSTKQAVFPNIYHSKPQSFVQPMFMPYIKGPKMDWTVNDSLYHRLLKWKLKCENILDCGLAMLPEAKKCKKVIVGSGYFGMHQYVSWHLPMKI